MKTVPFKKASNFANHWVLAEQLIQLGARPPIVSQLCRLSRQQSIDLYKSVNGCPPKQGMLPHDHQWVIQSAGRNIHASIFLGILDDIRQRLSIQHASAEVLVDAFSLYKNIASHIFIEPNAITPVARQFTLDINRAWSLISMLLAGDLIFTVCACCRVRFLSVIHPNATFSQCPICDVWTDRSGRRRWASAKSKKPN